MRADPAVLRQLQDLVLAQAARSGVVEVLERSGALLELRDSQARTELAILAIEPFIVDEQADELGFAQVLMIAPPESLADGVGHAEELHGGEFLVSLFIQHGWCSSMV